MGFFHYSARTVKCYDEDDEEGLMALHREWCDPSVTKPNDDDKKYNSLSGIGDGWWDQVMAEERESSLPLHSLPYVNHKQASKTAIKTAMSTLTRPIPKP
jgi:hypothetical protein